MFNGWKYFDTRINAYKDEPNRDGSQSEYFTNHPSSGWENPEGKIWVLTYNLGTNELLLFPQDSDESGGPVWVSPKLPDMKTTDKHLTGHESPKCDWEWLSNRLNNLPKPGPTRPKSVPTKPTT